MYMMLQVQCDDVLEPHLNEITSALTCMAIGHKMVPFWTADVGHVDL